MKHTGYISEKEKKNSRFFLLCIVEIIGILIGSYIAVSDTNTDWFRKFLCPVLNGGTLSEIFRSTFISSLIFIVAAFLFGLFAFGQPLGVALIISKGIEIGLSAAMMYSVKGISALPAVFILNVPKAVAVSVVMILAVREVIRNSMSILHGLIPEREYDSERADLKLYCIKFIVLIVIIFIISVADSLLNYIFASLV